MKNLTRCPSCGGFVPALGVVCPHCTRAPARATVRAIAKGVACIVAGGAVSVTLMACYGPPVRPGPVDAPPTPSATPATPASPSAKP